MHPAPLNLVKLSVGTRSVGGLTRWQQRRAKQRKREGGDARPMHVTRMTPRRAAELLEGGSIYWVIQRQIVARQRLVAIEPWQGKDGIPRCALVLDPKIVKVEPRPKRPFQGWRYLTGEDAPPDLTADGEAMAEMPAKLRAALSDLGIR